MIVVGDNLKALVQQHGIVDSAGAFDEASLTLTLAADIIQIAPDSQDRVHPYGDELPSTWMKRVRMSQDGYILSSRGCILACSNETIRMPLGYIGLMQTKGSLGRLFVTIHCCDGQVDPGYSGRVTFEICNLAPFAVKLLPGQSVAQLFILQTSTKIVKPYSGRYQNANGPTTFRVRG
jgi:dCTP deaminase